MKTGRGAESLCYFEREKLFGAILSLTNWEQITLLLLAIERLLCEKPWYDSEKVLHIHLLGPLKCWKCPPFLQKMHILEATTFSPSLQNGIILKHLISFKKVSNAHNF